MPPFSFALIEPRIEEMLMTAALEIPYSVFDALSAAFSNKGSKFCSKKLASIA